MSAGPYFIGDVPVQDTIVAVTRGGAPATLSDFTSGVATLLDPLGASVLPVPTVAIDASALVVNWPQESVFALAGVYTLILTLGGPASVSEVVDPVMIVVNSTGADSWVTPAYVQQVTRVAVDETVVASAVSVISLLVNRDLSDESVFSVADQRNMKFAIAWQSAFMTSNPTALTEVQASSKKVSDVAVTYDTSATKSSWLAPMARIALRKMSWKGSRTVQIGRLDDKVEYQYLNEAADAFTGWTPTR